MAAPAPLRREILFGFTFLFGAAVLVAVVGLLAVLPLLDSPTQIVVYVVALLAADLAIVFAFGNSILRSRFVRPIEELVADVQRIASGEYRHRVGGMRSPELEAIQDSVNVMADRLIRDQRRLAENVESLERTNRELLEARDQVIQSARLASVGTLAAGLAHEVGNPLGAVIGYVDVARRRVLRDGTCDPELLDDVREEAERIDRIVRGLLDYARPGEGDVRPVAPADVLGRVRSLLESQGRLDGVRDEWIFGDAPRVLLEPRQLEQVVVNLTLNALQAMEEREERPLRVELSSERGGAERLPPRREDDPPGVNYLHRRRLSGEEVGGPPDLLVSSERLAVITVEDAGPGIPEEALDRVFDPFYTTKEPGEGTGLGLSICARLVEGMGGRIEAENRPEGGARFTVRLPAVAEASEEEA